MRNAPVDNDEAATQVLLAHLELEQPIETPMGASSRKRAAHGLNMPCHPERNVVISAD
jgi:hypothetical protein